MLSKAITALEDEIVSLKDQAAREIDEVYAYLSRTGAKTKLRPRIKKNEGYSAFSIIWHRLIFYNWTNRQAKFKEIRKGRGYMVPKSRLMTYCRTCDSWEAEYIWEKELRFARVRKKVALLSRALTGLKRYCALEVSEVTEQGGGNPALVSVATFLTMEDIVKILGTALKSLKARTVQQVSEVSARLAEKGRMGLRPRIGYRRGSGVFSVQWVKQSGHDRETGLLIEYEIPREPGYSFRRSRLMAHCRTCEDCEKEFIWEEERNFARVRKQVDLLSKALTALRQYVLEGEGTTF